MDYAIDRQTAEATEYWRKWKDEMVKWKCGDKAKAVLQEIRRRRGMTHREIEDYAFRLTHPTLGPLPKGQSYWSDAWNCTNPYKNTGLIPYWCDKGADGKWRLKKGKRLVGPFWGDPKVREEQKKREQHAARQSEMFWAKLES